MSLGDSNNDRQPEMAADTGNTHIFETMKDIIKIPTTNPGLSTMASSIKVSPSDCDNDRQPEIAISTFYVPISLFGLSVDVAITWKHLSSSSSSKMPNFPLEFQCCLS